MPAASPRLRQAVLAAHDLEVADRLRAALGLGEPFADPGVSYFGLSNAVFALGDTFLEVVSPVAPGTSAGRLLERRGGDCGYMVMFQVDDLDGVRSRARSAGVREVFEVSLDDIAEVHLHPADMRGAIVAASQPDPPSSWRWGGPQWPQRAAQASVVGATIAVADPESVSARWQAVLGALEGVQFIPDASDRGLVEVAIAGGTDGEALEIGGVRFVFVSNEEGVR